MGEEQFRTIVEEEWDKVPSPYRERIENVALLVEDEPSPEVREREGLEEGDTLLGFYHGVPLTERGEGYGSGGTLPDTITIYRLPTLLEAEEVGKDVREIVHETIWHEVGHYFGYDDFHIHLREDEGTNEFGPR
jgi:predicted Zn-dependent protease with MMP-like domain